MRQFYDWYEAGNRVCDCADHDCLHRNPPDLSELAIEEEKRNKGYFALSRLRRQKQVRAIEAVHGSLDQYRSYIIEKAMTLTDIDTMKSKGEGQ